MIKKILFIILFFTQASLGATYYIDDTGDDTTGDGSTGSPWKTFTKAATVLGSGDTLIYKDGTYNYAGCVPVDPVSGTEGHLTTIQAENDGGAIFVGYGLSITSRDYISIQGFKFLAATTEGFRINHVTYSEFKRCAFRSGDVATEGSANTISNGCNHNLIEDCWFWGQGRYVLLMYGGYGDPCEYNTVRRAVVRYEGSETAIGSMIVSNYISSHNTWENVIIIDSNDPPDGQDEDPGAFRNRDGGSVGNKWLGCIVVGNSAGKWIPFLLAGYNSSQNLKVENCVAIGHGRTGTILTLTGSIYGTVTNFTGIDLSSSANAVSGGTANMPIDSSLWIDATNGAYANTYTHFDNSGSTVGTNATSGDSGLLYPVRIETGTAIDGTGNGGIDRGANILYRYVDGVLTATPLWPWPYEDRIKIDMAASFSLSATSNPATTDTTRGFTDIGKQLNETDDITLTSYIWEYLGNAIPTNIYVSSTVTGTVLASISESEIENKTIIYTLTGTTWVATIGDDNQITTDFLATITGNLDWSDVPITHAHLVRTSDTVLTLTLPAAASYDIASTETVSLAAVPASATALGETITPSPSSFTVSYIANAATPINVIHTPGGSKWISHPGGIAIVPQ